MPERFLGDSHFSIFVDDCTRKVWAYSTKSKDEGLEVFAQWLAEAENRFRYKLKTLRLDNAREYTSKDFANPYTPMQNGVAEPYNKE